MRNRFVVGVVALALMAIGLVACAGGSGSNTSLTSPTSTTTPPLVLLGVTPGIVGPPANATATEGDQLGLSITTAGYGSPTGRTSMGLALVRDDGAMWLIGCSSWNGGAESTMNSFAPLRPVSTFPNDLYAWAKGHTLDGVAMSATGVTFVGTCLFSPDTGSNPRPVYIDKATLTVKLPLGWKII